MPNYEITIDGIANILEAIDRAGCAIQQAESELNESAIKIEEAFTNNDIWTGLQYGVETMAALTPSASNFKTTMRNPNAILSGLVSEMLGRFQAIIPYLGLGSGILTIEQLLSYYQQGAGPMFGYSAGPGLRRAMEAINALDLKHWNYCYPVTPSRGYFLGRSLLGVFGAGISIDQTKFRGVAANQFWPTLYGGTPYTPIITGTVYDPATDTFVAGRTLTTSGPITNASPTFNTVGTLVPGGPTPAPANSTLVSVSNITGVHVGSSLYIGGPGGAGIWE